MTDNTELIGCVSHDCAACKKQAAALEAFQDENARLTAELTVTNVERNSAQENVFDLRTEVERLHSWIESAFDAHPNLDLDIKHAAITKGTP